MMNKLEDYTGESFRGFPHHFCKVKKEVLIERVRILTDVLQSLIEYVAEKEKVQLGVIAQSAPSGLIYKIYEEPLKEKPTP